MKVLFDLVEDRSIDCDLSRRKAVEVGCMEKEYTCIAIVPVLWWRNRGVFETSLVNFKTLVELVKQRCVLGVVKKEWALGRFSIRCIWPRSSHLRIPRETWLSDISSHKSISVDNIKFYLGTVEECILMLHRRECKRLRDKVVESYSSFGLTFLDTF